MSITLRVVDQIFRPTGKVLLGYKGFILSSPRLAGNSLVYYKPMATHVSFERIPVR